MAPQMNWPCPPILNTPVENPSATPVPVRMRGVADTRVSEIGVKTVLQPDPVEMACPTAEGLNMEPVKSAP
jgi:hypothetical protein